MSSPKEIPPLTFTEGQNLFRHKFKYCHYTRVKIDRQKLKWY